MTDIPNLADVRRAKAVEARAQQVLVLIERQRFCPYTGENLTVDSVVLVNKIGEPIVLISQEGWREMNDDMLTYLARRGTKVDRGTIR